MGYTAKCVGLLSSFLQTQGGGIKMVVKYDWQMGIQPEPDWEVLLSPQTQAESVVGQA